MRKPILLLTVASIIGLGVSTARAKVDLVTLPEREAVQLTIYNKADLTLVNDQRALTFKKGVNRLQFSWANTLIDPTSLHMDFEKGSEQIDLLNISYPPRVKDVGVWELHSDAADQIPVKISYFTSGLTWRSFYMATLAPDEKSMELKGYVRVTNNSGEDYENAKTRLVVGKINLLDRIAELAQREAPYGQPVQPRPPRPKLKAAREKARRTLALETADAFHAQGAAPKEITKEGLSEYFLYTIEGTETIPNGWSKRLPSFSAGSVAVVNYYKYDERRFGQNAVRFLRFHNDKEHNLGETPLPGGQIKVYGRVNENGELRYVGADNTKYIPVDQKVELNLGAADEVEVEPKIMDFRKENLVFDNKGNVNGFDDIKDFQIKVSNYSALPATVEITRHIPSGHWELKNTENPGAYEKVDQNTVKYTLTLDPREEKYVKYTLTVYQGDRRWNH